jgi:Cys-rich repeat protein
VNHRPLLSICNDVRTSTVPDGGFGLTTGYCSSDMECTARDAGLDGRCTIVPALGYSICTYDACFTDSDCSDGGVCVCRDATNGGANLCVPSDCRVDADCGDGGYCSPTVNGCAPYIGVEGYFCHLPADLCVNDSDCASPNHCVYDAAIPKWICAPLSCSG